MVRLRRLVLAAMIAALGSAPASAVAQSGPGDKFLGSINLFTDPQFVQYFDQVTPENAGKWGSAAGTTRTAAMRWGQLDQAYAFAKANGFGFNFHVLLWGNQQPTWMATLPPDEQLIEIKKWFAAVAARYPAIDWLQVVNEATWDPPDGSVPKNAGANFASSGNYVQALGGANGTDGTGYDWILNAFRLARQYFPNTKLMINDVAITGMTAATDEYLKIINILKRENLIDVVGLQAHAFEFIPNNPNVPSIPGHPYEPVTDMAVHKANLDRLAATGVPIQITELDLDGLTTDGVPGDEVQLAYYRRVVPTFWEHPGVKGVTLWGWKQPSHWRNAQNAPIVLSTGALKPAGHWLLNYVNGIAPVIRADQRFTLTDANAAAGVVQADDWASQIGRPNLRTFTWTITGGTGAGIFAIAPSTGEVRVADQRLLDENSTYSLQVRVSDGFNTSHAATVSITTGDLANVVDQTVGASVPATLSLALGGDVAFGAFTPGVARDYTAATTATVTSTAGDATLTYSEPGHLTNGAFTLPSPLTVELSKSAWTGPVSNDPVALTFRQHIGAGDALRTGTYSRTLTFTLSTTAP
jgi:endo-1,4-beta-xylanase